MAKFYGIARRGSVGNETYYISKSLKEAVTLIFF